MKTSSRKQLYISKCPQNITFSTHNPHLPPITHPRLSKLLLFLILLFPSLSAHCVCFSSSPRIPKQSWASFPGGTGAAQPEGQEGSTHPATHSRRVKPELLTCRGTQAGSFPSCPWKISPSKSQCIMLALCLAAQKGFSNGSIAAETVATTFFCISYSTYQHEENVLKYSDVHYTIN